MLLFVIVKLFLLSSPDVPGPQPIPATQRTTAAATRPSPLPTVPTGRLDGRIRVRQFRFVGNTVFTDSELQAIVRVYLGDLVSIDDIENARRAVTAAYADRGFVTSLAVLPEQDILSETVTLEIIEGQLINVNVRVESPDGLTLDPGYASGRIRYGAGPVVNAERLRDTLQLLRQNPNIEQLNAELRPGNLANADLDVTIRQAPPLSLALVFSNYRSPSVGAEQVDLVAEDRNLSGESDDLYLRTALTNGGFDNMHAAGSDDYSIEYSRPLNDADTTLLLSWSDTNNSIVEAPLDRFNIDSRTRSLSIGVRQPLYRSPSTEFAVAILAAYRTNHTAVLGEDFSISPGAEDGKSSVSVVRFVQELSVREQSTAWSARSTITAGFDALNATEHGGSGGGNTTDGQFVAWLAQAQAAWRLHPGNTVLVVRGSGQLASGALLPLEQFVVGGVDTVRGYRENTMVRDIGVEASIELRIPLLEKNDRSIIELVPFVDAGYADDLHRGTPGDGLRFISSAGAGLICHPIQDVDISVFYGKPFQNTGQTSNLQDLGLHFEVRVGVSF